MSVEAPIDDIDLVFVEIAGMLTADKDAINDIEVIGDDTSYTVTVRIPSIVVESTSKTVSDVESVLSDRTPDGISIEIEVI